MAASDQPYRNQTTLDLVFGITGGLMLLTTLWMFWDDYNRPFKVVQRTFRDVESTIAQREMIDKLPDPDLIQGKTQEVQQARAALAKAKTAVADDERELKAKREQADEKYRGIKAEFDAQTSYYNIAIDDAGKYPASSARAQGLKSEADRIKAALAKLEADLAAAKADLDAIDARMKEQVGSKLAEPEKKLADAEEELKKLTGNSDRFAKQAAQRAWATGDTIRALPILDGFESPTKIQQIWLPDLTIDYSFKEVPRYDRCTTCHLGIDRGTFDRDVLTRLGNEEESARLTSKLLGAKKLLEKRADPVPDTVMGKTWAAAFGPSYTALGFSPNDLPGERKGNLGVISLLIFLCAIVAAVSLGVLERSMRLGVRTLVVGLAITLGTSFALAVSAPKTTSVKAIDLSPAQVSQYATHPRLDLFVDANSPHSMEKFGCTICHAGQGSATSFNLASHTPDGTPQEERWKKEHHYHASHYWDYPMLPKRFVESSCLKCHHQVTDLVRQGGKEEAPKLLRGYNLVREMGCFGCHEIQGVKSGRAVGPDMRLEPTPALDLLSAAEQEKAKADPLNPPGTYRKVGPSLRRLAEKTGLDWTVKWIKDPRGFREDTKMPHFYEMATNSAKALPDDQKHFPAAEMQAIAYYLISESKAHLDDKDTYRESLLKGKNNLNALQAKLIAAGLSDREVKELYDVCKRFADLALLSSPRQSRAISAAATRQRQLQEKMADLHKRGLDAVKAEAAATKAELTAVTTELVALAKPSPLTAGIITDAGDKVELPAKDGNLVSGRQLFTEKGCLACHAHNGTTAPVQKDAASVAHPVTSEANFGPELSRIADKLEPAVDKLTARAWLVQWLLNPNVYHPRTRMPVTHLTVEQANDIASWLLSQKTKWQGSTTEPKEPKPGELDPKDPNFREKEAGYLKVGDYKSLARVYLAKAPGVTAKDLDKFLPAAGDSLTDAGIPEDRLANFGRDADERYLAEGKVTREALKMYIGKKAIGRLGCYACHDIPGFETAKPIGVGLNDWGKKDGARIAFEDGAAYVKGHYNIVPSRVTRAELQAAIDALKAKETDGALSQKESDELKRLEARVKPETQREIEELEAKALASGLTAKEKAKLAELHEKKLFEPAGDKEPFEQTFFEALEHHQREGFLHLKLADPRSYDYNRLRPWDDRLRMPQFKFARTRKLPGEADEAFHARQEKLEAEAREAVMTFILGLVAEPVPLKYVHNPNPEKKAEIVGRQVLDKYNCAGCHQVRPGMFEFKTADVQNLLVQSYKNVSADSFLKDHVFQNHNAWFGAPAGERQTAVGYRDPVATAQAAEDITSPLAGSTAVYLTEALKVTDPADRVTRDLPAGNRIYLPAGSYKETAPYGGTWTDLMVQYLNTKDKGKYALTSQAEARKILPPTLLREGERVQPDWLYKFLLNPQPVRPQFPESAEGVILRMPKFNMSPEESRALVNYFAAVSKVTNPGAGVTAPYVYIDQREPEFWKRTAEQYEKSFQDQLAAAKAELGKAKGDAAKEKLWQDRVKAMETIWADKDKAPKDATTKDLYSRSAYKLLTNTNLCLQCHSIGPVYLPGAKGPNLALAAERLRPEWTEQWVAHPTRMFPYLPTMPANFENNPDPLQWKWQEQFVGTPLQQTRAVRDLIMDQSRLADLLRHNPPPTPPPSPATTGGK